MTPSTSSGPAAAPSIQIFETPLGPMLGVADAALRALEFTDPDTQERRLARLRRRLGPFHPGPNEVLRRAATELDAYFAGELREFTLPIEAGGSAFQRSVWTALLEIPYGATRSYGEQARRIGQPEAARAVGAANGENPVAIIIPCHRVIGSDGSLTGYGGGVWRKRWLLDHEARHAGFEGLPLGGTGA